MKKSMFLAAAAFLMMFLGGCSTKQSNCSAEIDGTHRKALAGIASYSGGRLHLLLGFSEPQRALISVDVTASQPGGYSLNSPDKDAGNAAGYSFGPKGSVTSYVTTSERTGTVQIAALDTVARTVSGTFEFTAVEIVGRGGQTGSRIVRVKQGSFEDVPIKDELNF